MTDDPNRRAETARENDDSDMVTDNPTPGQGDRSGGSIAGDIGSEDEEKRAIEGEDAGLTRVDKSEEANRGEATDRPADMR